MRRWPWILVGLAVVVAGVLAYAAANLNRYLSENRDMLAERASSALGRKVSFDKVEVSFAHGLGVAVDGLSVADDPRFADGSFLDAGRAVVRVRVLPALFGRYEIASVLLEQPSVVVIKTKDGLNVSSLGAKTETPPAAEAPSSSGAVVVALVDIESGKLVYRDRTVTPPNDITVDALDLSASDWSAGESLRFEMAAAVLGAAEPNIKASGAVGPFDPEDSGAAALDVVVQLDDVDAKAIVAALASSAVVRASGPIRGRIHAGGSVGAPSLEVNVDAGAADVAYGTTLDKPADVPFSLVGNIARNAKGTIALDPMALTLGSAVLNCVGSLEPARDSYAYALTLTGASMALDALGRIFPALGAQTVRGSADVDLKVTATTLGAPERINGKLSFDALEIGGGERDVPLVSQLTSVLSFDGRAMTMPRSELRIAGQPATLEATCPDVYAPRVRFSLVAPALAIAELGIGGAAEGDALENLTVTGVVATTAEGTDLDADVRAASGKLAGMTLTQLDAKVKRRGGSFDVTPLSFNTSGGVVRGNASYATAQAGGSDSFRFDGKAEGVSIAGLLAGFAGAASGLLDGKLSADLHAQGAGNDWPSIRQALSGNGRIDLTGGAIRGVNVAEGALAGITGLPGLSALLPQQLRSDFPLFFGTDDTRFDKLSAGLQIAAGRIATNDLAVTARDFLMQAGGTIGLDGSVDLDATLLPSLELSQRLIQSAALMKHLADRSGRVAIPFKLVGSLPEARPVPDMSALTGALQRELIDNVGDRILDGIKKPALPNAKPEEEKKRQADTEQKPRVDEVQKKEPAPAEKKAPLEEVQPKPKPEPKPTAPADAPAGSTKPMRPKKPAAEQKPPPDVAPKPSVEEKQPAPEVKRKKRPAQTAPTPTTTVVPAPAQ